MFKKAGDNVHYLGRTGSHSTKGSRRGVDHMAPATSEDFNSEQNIILRRRRIKELKRVIAGDIVHATKIKAVMLDAAENGNTELMDALRPILQELNDKIRADKSERDDLKALTPKRLHPGRRPDYEDMRRSKVTAYLLKYPPAWWGAAADRRKKKYLKWLSKIGTVDETKFR